MAIITFLGMQYLVFSCFFIFLGNGQRKRVAGLKVIFSLVSNRISSLQQMDFDGFGSEIRESNSSHTLYSKCMYVSMYVYVVSAGGC